MTLTNYKLFAIKPKAATNLVTNPSFETVTTGWATGGTNTIARSATVARRGAYSCIATYQNTATNLASYAITLTAVAYVGSLDVYIPTAYNGTELVLTFSAYAGATVTDGDLDMTIRDNWQRVTCKITPVGGDLVGSLIIYEAGAAPTAGEFIYIDGVQIETGTAATTYLDGDNAETVNGIRQFGWNGAAHASTSYRLSSTRSGGLLVDIADYCKKVNLRGLGIAPVSPNEIDLVDGSTRYQGSTLRSRYFTIEIAFSSTTIGAVQANRNALTNLIKPDLVLGNQLLTLRYQGFDVSGAVQSEPVDIQCYYVSGLDVADQKDFERANLIFKMPSPYVQKAADSAAVLAFNASLANADYIVKRDRDGVWSAMAGVTGSVYTIAQHPITGEIYIGGNFLNAGEDANADYLAKWNGSAWVSVIAGINDYIKSMVFDAQGNLYIVGKFINLGDANGDYIAKINTVAATVSSLGTGLNNEGRTIIIDRSGNIYAGGNFTLAGGVANTAYIAKWNGTVWTPLSTGLSARAESIVIDAQGNLYIVGWFTNAGDANGDYIIKWTGSAWVSLGTGSNALLYAAILDDFENLYVGGVTTSLGGVSVGYWGKWNGQKWEALGTGFNEQVYALYYNDNEILASGFFTSAGGVSVADRTAIYLGNGIYLPLDISFPSTPNVLKITKDNQENLYFGYTTAGTATVAGYTTITTGGATTYPKITITGPGLLLQIKNNTTNKAIYFNDLTLLAGEVITLDLRPGNVKMNSTWRGNILPYVVNGSSYDFPLLPGANNISTYMTGTSAATSVVMEWQDNYHGVDGAQYV